MSVAKSAHDSLPLRALPVELNYGPVTSNKLLVLNSIEIYNLTGISVKRQGQRYHAKIDTFYVGHSTVSAAAFCSSAIRNRDSFVFTFQWFRCSAIFVV